MKQRLNEWYQRTRSFAQEEVISLLAVAIAAGLVWGFVELAEDVMEGETRAVDERLLTSLRTPGDLTDPLGPDWFEESVRDVSALGSQIVLILMSAAAAGFLLLSGQRWSCGLLVVAIAGGLAVSTGLKSGFERPRPDLVPHETRIQTTSFPSQHAMMSATTYLTLGALMAGAQRRRRAKVYLLVWAVAFTLLVGLSRVYLGVHWPTDILAGWSAGAVWALGSWLVLQWLQRLRPREKTPADG